MMNSQAKEETQERRYPKRVRFAPDRYVANAARRGAHDDDMPTLRMAMESPEALEWKKAIKSELDSLEKNRTWDIVDKPSKARAIFCKWVLKKKRTADGRDKSLQKPVSLFAETWITLQ